MKIFALSGLGADERVFQYLKLQYELIPLKWIPPTPNDTLGTYAEKLIDAYHLTSEKDYCLLGLSFGGMIASELSLRLHPRLTILISSAETSREVAPMLKIIGKTGLLKLVPANKFDPPRFIAQYLFDTEHKELLSNILDDTDRAFAKWAANALMNWDNQTKLPRVLKIGGSKDRLLPVKDPGAFVVQGGGHFMIVDRAQEVSEIINRELARRL